MWYIKNLLCCCSNRRLKMNWETVCARDQRPFFFKSPFLMSRGVCKNMPRKRSSVDDIIHQGGWRRRREMNSANRWRASLENRNKLRGYCSYMFVEKSQSRSNMCRDNCVKTILSLKVIAMASWECTDADKLRDGMPALTSCHTTWDYERPIRLL